MCKFCKQRAANAFVNLDLFHSYHDYFLQNYTIKCQHNQYLESIKKHNRQKIREIPKSIIGKLWSIIDSSLAIATSSETGSDTQLLATIHCYINYVHS